MLPQEGDGKMEMMFVLAGMMSMLLVSLIFQQVAYRKVTVEVQK